MIAQGVLSERVGIAGSRGEQVRSFFLSLQNDLCSSLEKIDGKARFGSDSWDRVGGGGGITRVIQGSPGWPGARRGSGREFRIVTNRAAIRRET